MSRRQFLGWCAVTGVGVQIILFALRGAGVWRWWFAPGIVVPWALLMLALESATHVGHLGLAAVVRRWALVAALIVATLAWLVGASAALGGWLRPAHLSIVVVGGASALFLVATAVSRRYRIPLLRRPGGRGFIQEDGPRRAMK
jgi:hypothetical protein